MGNEKKYSKSLKINVRVLQLSRTVQKVVSTINQRMRLESNEAISERLSLGILHSQNEYQ
jgi:hypothetical protein